MKDTHKDNDNITVIDTGFVWNVTDSETDDTETDK